MFITEFLPLIFTALMIGVAFFTGRAADRRHLKRIKHQENATRDFITTNFEPLPKGWQVETSQLVTGSVVISIDYFKRIMANLKGFFGGRIGVYEPIVDRARREALLRMKRKAIKQGYDAVINVRIEKYQIASTNSQSEGTAGVEILAFGTAVRLVDAKPAPARTEQALESPEPEYGRSSRSSNQGSL